MHRIAAAAFATALVTTPAVAGAGDLDIAAGIDAQASGWADDDVGYTSLKVTYLLRDWVGPTFLGKLGYGSVDERVLSYFFLGGELRQPLGSTRPYVRAGLVHQHEEPVVAIENAPLEAILGVGDGIRHRAGGAAGVGIDVPFRGYGSGDFYVAVDVGATWFIDDRGPRWYAGAGVALGLRWDRGGADGR